MNFEAVLAKVNEAHPENSPSANAYLAKMMIDMEWSEEEINGDLSGLCFVVEE